jgi:hypothetical protein
MLRKSVTILAIAILLESSGLSTAALARSKDTRSALGAFNAEHYALGVGTGSAAVGGHDRRGARVEGLRGPLRAYGHRDVWGHWGSYYGPMVAVPF